VDIEGGYSRDVSQVCENIYKLAYLGVAGVNIEDSAVVDGKREMLGADETAEKLKRIKAYCADNKIEIFLNLRTDPYLLNVEDRFNETLSRIALYEKAGADGIFIPCLTDSGEMKEFTGKTSLPVNVMCMPDLPGFDELAEVGIKRITMGPFMFEYLAKQQANACGRIRDENNFKALF
jgi:2-methylisocitrate lyase-like PEP mutase family enzyme